MLVGEINESINKKNSILLTRNTPVALVVGAAGFLGSHLVDKLLSKGIQVIGVDDLEIGPPDGRAGRKENLHKASENKNFHLIIDRAQSYKLDLARLDYLYIDSQGGWNLENILELFKKFKCRLLFLSSIDLYDKEKDGEGLKWLKHAEAKIAGFAAEHNLNARILRLGPVFGPRMDFRIVVGTKDPIIRLIQQALIGDLQKDVSLEFSTRALYVDDAVDLMIKTIFSGSTAQKIFDGVLPAPIKVSEIKQVLLDPIWYESKNFIPSELPPWPTPNFDKTRRILNWHPKTPLVASLRQTLAYFKDNEIYIPKPEAAFSDDEKEKRKEAEKWKKDKAGELASFKKLPEAKRKVLKIAFFSSNKLFAILAVFLITYSLIWPGIILGWGILTFRYQLQEAAKNLRAGEFEKSLGNVKQAEFAVFEVKSVLDALDTLRQANILKDTLEVGDDFSSLANLSVASAQSTILGIQALFQGLKAVTGELNDSPSSYFTSAQVELSLADENLSRAFALLKKDEFNKRMPQILKSRVDSLTERLTDYSDLVKKARALSSILPSIVAPLGSKDYLILLQNNMELRPTGGFIGSFAKVSFEAGKLKKLEANDIYAIDGQLTIHVEPPKEIKDDLGQNRWFLRDSNFEPDFPTAARQAQWFYTKETGERVEGVVALDISAIEQLLSVIGSLDLPDYNEKITSENLFERAISHAELSFFPGSQAKKSFLTALINQVFNKLFFLPNQNWPGIVTALGRSLEEKHLSIYLDDPRLFSYLVAQNWAHVLPRAQDQNSKADFLALVEANLGANKANYYLDRSYFLETVVGKEGEIKHRLRITYLNRSPSDAFPGGKYKNRMRIYLPFGSKLDRVLWGETDKTADVTSFVDYGRSGYSLLLELAPKEQKILILDYSVPVKLEFKEGKASYRLDIVKQAGTLKDPLNWRITYPISFKVVSNQASPVGPQEQTIKTDLSKDRSFEVTFSK